MNRKTVGVCVILAAIAASSSAPSAAAQSVASSKTFKVVVHGDDDGLAKAALRVAESVLQAAPKVTGRLKQPAQPLTIDIHLDGQSAAIEAPLATADSTAAADGAVLPPPVSASPAVSKRAIEAYGLPVATRRAVARDAARLVAREAAESFDAQPQWLRRGGVLWIAEQALAAGGASAGLESDPAIGSIVLRAQYILKNADFPTASNIMLDQWGTFDAADRDGIALLYFTFLQTKQGSKFESTLAKIRTFENGADLTRRAFDAMTAKTFRSETLDADFKAWVRGLRPRWSEAAPDALVAGKAITLAAGPRTNAQIIATKALEKRDFTISGETEILQSAAKMLYVLLGATESGFTSVHFEPGVGVEINVYSTASNEWTEMARSDCPELAAETPTAFKIAVANDKITVSVKGKSVLEATIQDRALTGHWGLGAMIGSAGRWTGVAAVE